jgi:hypothetical protein
MTCTARVWGNGDCEDCGRAVVRADRCAEHAEGEASRVREAIAKCEEDLMKHRHRLAALTGSVEE